MGKSRAQVRTLVEKKLGRTLLHRITTYVEQQNPSLWAHHRPRGFVRDCILAALYKDTYRVGYNALFEDVKEWVGVTSRTFRHNTNVIRKVEGEWGQQQIVLGSAADWNRAATDVPIDPVISGTCLWIDSVDFRRAGKASTSRKSSKWSYKTNSPARRFMFLLDGRTRIRKLWGGYSPKLYDGRVLETKADWLRKHLEGAVVVGDEHFQWGKKHLTPEVTFHTPHRQPRKRKKGAPKRQLTAAQNKYNTAIHQARARVEHPFAMMGQRFEALQGVWFESSDQLDHLVKLAVGVHNTLLR
jgi:hypothetical protein